MKSLLATCWLLVLGGLSLAAQDPRQLSATDRADGPYVFWKNATTAEVMKFVDGKVAKKTYSDIVKPREVMAPGTAESTILLDPSLPKPPKSVWPAPKKLMAISDLEGNYTNTVRFLKNAKVIDAQGHWAWKDGHLVLIGDLVDRGYQVTELMWLLRRLEREAQAAGGELHYILGNHEVMVMGGDLRYIHPKYQYMSQQFETTYDKLYGADTDIGRWWRSKNSVEVIGDLLFVHGGYSPSLEALKLSPEKLNTRIRKCLPPAKVVAGTIAENPVADILGPFWYRGYFAQYAAGFGGKTPPDKIVENLKRHNAKHVVVGHTVVKQVGFLDSTKTVIGTDVKWADPDAGEGLLMEGKQLYRVDISGKREPL